MKKLSFLILGLSFLLMYCGNDDDDNNPDNGNYCVLTGTCIEVENEQMFPADNPWNTDISQSAVDPNSDILIASMGADDNLHPDFGTEWAGSPIGIPFIVVCDSQPKVLVSFSYDDESDPGPYPIPDDAPIEGGSDRHVLVFDKDNHLLYELFDAEKVVSGWTAGSGAIFDLTTNVLRSENGDFPSLGGYGLTSADAAGLPILPGLIRYEEVVTKGVIDHALRFTASQTRKAYLYPATHHAGTGDPTDTSLPPMGMRIRLKANVDISGYSAYNQIILTAMKTYGLILADNGSDWFVSGQHHMQWDDDELSELKDLSGSDFEVLLMNSSLLTIDN